MTLPLEYFLKRGFMKAAKEYFSRGDLWNGMRSLKMSREYRLNWTIL